MGLGLVGLQHVAARLLTRRVVGPAREGRRRRRGCVGPVEPWRARNVARRTQRVSGNGWQRPKPAQLAMALGRNLTREEWIEELTADPPNPAHPEFRTPGAWERWVRGAFRAHKKTGDAKYSVKTKRANADMEVRGADPDYNSRGGRSAAMDPSTASSPPAERGGGQERQGRSRNGWDDSGTPAAWGCAASSSSTWWEGGGSGGCAHQDNGHRDAGPSPADDGAAAPHAAPDGHAAAAGPGEPPPGLGNGAKRDDAATETGTTAVNDGESVSWPGVRGDSGFPGGLAAGAQSAEGDLGQVDRATGSRSRHGSPGPVVPSHCEGDTTAIGGAWPGGSLRDGSSTGSVDHDDAMGGGSAAATHDGQALLSPLGASGAGGGVSSETQQGPCNGGGARDGLPRDDDGAHGDGALPAKLEADAPPSPPGAGAPSGSGAPPEAPPVPCDEGGGGMQYDGGSERPLGGASEADDGLPSFSPTDEAPADLPAPDDAVLGATDAHNTPDEEAVAQGHDLPLLTAADEGHGEGGQVGGTQPPRAGASECPPNERTTGAGALPHGVVSPPAVTVFGGGIGVAPTSGSDDNTNIAHSVPLDSDSDSDLGAPAPATGATNEAAASEAAGSTPSPAGSEGIRQ